MTDVSTQMERFVAPLRLRLSGRNIPFIGPLVALALLATVLSIAKPFFYSTANLTNIVVTNAPLMIVAIGMTVAIISGGLDMSIGSMVAISGITVHLALSAGVPELVAVLLALLVGPIVGGLTNGVLIGKVKLNFFVVTLGMMTTLTGVAYVLTGGQTKTLDSGVIAWIGNGSLGPIPAPIVVLSISVVGGWYLLSQTPLGRNIYAIGGNREAARLSGINVVLVVVLVYGIAGLFGSIAGVVQAGILSAAAPTAGASFALTAGAAVLLGGTSFSGGYGGVTGTVVGVLLIAVLQNGLGLFGVASFWQEVVTGIVLIAAVAFDRFRRVRQTTKKPA